jgi:hypothetical protein
VAEAHIVALRQPKSLDHAALSAICLTAGGNDVGFVDIERVASPSACREADFDLEHGPVGVGGAQLSVVALGDGAHDRQAETVTRRR